MLRNSIFITLLILITVSCTSNSGSLHNISVKEFSEFVKETGYVTDAEKYGWSIVQKTVYDFITVKGATWQKPDGKNSTPMDFPVTQVSYNDAQAYCKWAQVKLPTYQEYWELAKKDKRPIIENAYYFSKVKDVNIVGNVWDITQSQDGIQTRLAGGSIFCERTTCNGTSPKRELFVDLATGNIHIGFSVILKK